MPPRARRTDYDQALKRLLAGAHQGVLALLMPGARWLGERNQELRARRRQADLVWEVAIGGGERVLLHIELQTRPDPQIGERLAEYAIRLWRRDRLPVHSVVLYLREGGNIPNPPFVFGRGGGEEALRYSYEARRLWTEPPERVLALPEAGAWPLAALMAGATAETVARVARRLAQAPLPAGERAELAGLLTILAGLRLPRAVMERLLREDAMIRDLLSDSSVVAIWREEGEARGREEGEARGREEGEARGREEGQREIVRTVLESRFGPLEPEEAQALAVADAATVRALGAQIATTSRSQIRARLGLP